MDISVCGTRLAVMWNSSVALLDLRSDGDMPAELNAIGSFDFGLSVARAGPVGLAPAGLDLAHLVATLDDQGYLRVWDFDVNPAECVRTIPDSGDIIVSVQDDEDVRALLDNLTQIMGPEHR